MHVVSSDLVAAAGDRSHRSEKTNGRVKKTIRRGILPAGRPISHSYVLFLSSLHGGPVVTVMYRCSPGEICDGVSAAVNVCTSMLGVQCL